MAVDTTTLIQQHEQLKLSHNELKCEYAELKYKYDQLVRLIRNSKRERFVPAPAGVPDIFEGTEDELITKEEGATPKPTKPQSKRRRSHPGRTPLPENIPTEDIVIEPEVEDLGELVCIGEVVTETIDYSPGELRKRRYIRKKYVLKNPSKDSAEESTVIIGELPERPIPKGIAEAGLLAHLMVSKYVDHLPFYRQIQQFDRNFGWQIHKSTLNDWFANCCSLLKPLEEALRQKVLHSDYIQVDESPIKVLKTDKKNKAHQGYQWVYRNPINKLVLFDYQSGRSVRGPKEVLKEYSGYIQSDGYSVYQTLAKHNPGWKQVRCLAHIRRKFYAARDHHKELANHALKEIQLLYEVERRARKEAQTPEQMQKLRQQDSRPVYERLLQWVQEQQSQNLSKGPIGKALLYAKNHLPLLESYLEDGRIEIDNNLIENAIRPLALGRKNYLFAGSTQGAQRAAMMYSFFASCKTQDINPWQWLKQVLEQIPTTSIKEIATLLPGNLKLEN